MLEVLRGYCGVQRSRLNCQGINFVLAAVASLEANLAGSFV